MATTLLQRIISSLKDIAPGVLTTWGSPGIPDIGETDWSGVTALEAAVDEFANVTDGQLLIGKTGSTGLAAPTTAPAITGAIYPGASIPAGTYEVGYTYTNAYGETTLSPVSSVTFASGTSNIINVASQTLPAGVLELNWYVSDAPGSTTLRLKTVTTGSGFGITLLPALFLDTPPTSNTTGCDNHPVKANITGSNGIVITNGPGTIDTSFSPTGDISATAGRVTTTAVQHVPFSVTGPTNGQTPVYNSTSGQAEWGNVVATAPATTTAKGIGKVSVGPVDPVNPIFVGDNDPRLANTLLGTRCEKHAATTISSSTFTKISFDTEIYDVGGYHDNATNPTRLTVPVGNAGYYHIIANAAFGAQTGGGAGAKQLSIKYNNTTTIAKDGTDDADGGTGACLTTSAVYYLDNGGYVEMVVWQDTGGTIDVGNAGGDANLTMFRVGG